MATQFRILALLLLVLAFPFTAAVGAEKLPWYQVEIIIFSRPGAGLGSEHGSTTAPQVPPGRDLVAWRGFAGADTVPFQRLPANALLMKREYDRIKAAADLHPLVHVGWLQPGFARENALAVRIGSAEEESDRVEGSLRLTLSRYLHLETNLLFHRGGEEAGGPVYQLTESRRMRSKEYHYLDHPAFGMVVLVTPYEPAKAAAKPAQ